MYVHTIERRVKEQVHFDVTKTLYLGLVHSWIFWEASDRHNPSLILTENTSFTEFTKKHAALLHSTCAPLEK